ncbi:MAG: pantetheine-phosphate adenylyltransferase [Paramuribaculum sp.]|nr:pantetheine-phosphate adenylyltransferase [Paramuribaculum sp.]MDE6304840.1 pantetheine-phosphate adenylyltransferase [Paramuribaculum sp.]
MTRKFPDTPDCPAPVAAFYAGSFNPFTLGHLNIVERALKIFPRVIIGVGLNPAKPSSPEDVEKRLEAIRLGVAHLNGVEVIAYSDLTVREARRRGASVLLRGVRSTTDFDYERNLAEINRAIAPDLDTVILTADPGYSAISSSAVRELSSYGEDVSRFLPPVK